MKNTNTTRKKFYAPINRALELSSNRRACIKFQDIDFFSAMLERIIDKSSSGREYVQYLNLTTDIKIGNSCFFNSLKSRRRQRLTNEVCSSVKRELDSLTTKESDPFSKHPELDNFNIYAADGTELKSSAHETLTFGKRYPVSHIFALNLRTHSSAHVCYLKPEKLKKKKHEIKVYRNWMPMFYVWKRLSARKSYMHMIQQ